MYLYAALKQRIIIAGLWTRILVKFFFNEKKLFIYAGIQLYVL